MEQYYVGAKIRKKKRTAKQSVPFFDLRILLKQKNAILFCIVLSYL